MSVIELDGLEVRLGGRTVLDSLTGDLRGKAIGLLGPNGAGKSTLINTLLGFHFPHEDRHAYLDWIRGASGRKSARPSVTCRRTTPSSAA